MWPARRLTVALSSLALLLAAAGLTGQLVVGLRALQRVQTELAELPASVRILWMVISIKP